MADEKIVADGVGPALGGAGAPCPEITFVGKTWKVGWPTQDARLWMELLVAQRAEDQLEERRRTLAPEKYAEKADKLDRQISAGKHRVQGELWLDAAGGPDAMPLFLCSLLKEHHPKATLADARVLWGACTRQVRRAMALVLPPFLPILFERVPAEQEEKDRVARTYLEAVLPLLGDVTEQTPNSSPAPSA